ncbi:MAG: HD domain-containing protein [Myxococcota bacterium]|jgi:putative hydrolase of HD superfamily|nr:HD domain-containing protein [Myxococcota bacterium]
MNEVEQPAPTEDAAHQAALQRFFAQALRLKRLRRSGWVRKGVREPESVAEHSWGVALMVAVLCPTTLNRERALMMAVLHDLAETIVGDLTPHDLEPEGGKRAAETKAMQQLLEELDNGDALRELWLDYEHLRSPEAAFVKACDKLEMGLQALSYEREQGAELEEFCFSARAALTDFSTLQALVNRASWTASQEHSDETEQP